jgi:hypothetical protein
LIGDFLLMAELPETLVVVLVPDIKDAVLFVGVSIEDFSIGFTALDLIWRQGVVRGLLLRRGRGEGVEPGRREQVLRLLRLVAGATRKTERAAHHNHKEKIRCKSFAVLHMLECFDLLFQVFVSTELMKTSLCVVCQHSHKPQFSLPP